MYSAYFLFAVRKKKINFVKNKLPMKKYIFILAGVFFSNCILAQPLARINQQLDSLNNVKKDLQVKIKDCQSQLQVIKTQIDALETKKSLLNRETSSGDFITAKVSTGGAILRDAPSSTGKTLLTIPANETIQVYRYQQNLYFKVVYNSQVGYVSYSTIAQNQEIDDYLAGKEVVKQPVTTTTVRTVDENDPKYQKLVKLYGKENAIKIMNSELWQGMSYGMVIESMGKPVSKNSENTTEGSKEIWVYSNYTLTFLNGELKDWKKK